MQGIKSMWAISVRGKKDVTKIMFDVMAQEDSVSSTMDVVNIARYYKTR